MKNKPLKSTLLNIIGYGAILMILSVQNLQAQENVITFNIGSHAVTLLSEGQRQGGTNILIGATEQMLKQAIPNGAYPSATNVFLVETEDKTLLFDAGLGRKTVENLEIYEKNASDIDAVFITHFHGDHIGSLLLNDKKSFPNATLYISKPEHDYYMSDEAMSGVAENRRSGFVNARKIINAYKNNLNVFTPKEIDVANELFPGVRAVAAYGHTPGHTGYLLESGGSKIFIWGDLTHAMAIQMPFPQVAVTYDSDTVKAVECRRKLLKYISENKILVAGAHIQYPAMGKVTKNMFDGYNFAFMCTCEGRTPESK